MELLQSSLIMWNKSIVQEILKTDDTDLMHFASSAQIHPHQGHRISPMSFSDLPMEPGLQPPLSSSIPGGNSSSSPCEHSRPMDIQKRNHFRPEKKEHGGFYKIYKHKMSDGHDLGCVLRLFFTFVANISKELFLFPN